MCEPKVGYSSKLVSETSISSSRRNGRNPLERKKFNLKRKSCDDGFFFSENQNVDVYKKKDRRTQLWINCSHNVQHLHTSTYNHESHGCLTSYDGNLMFITEETSVLSYIFALRMKIVYINLVHVSEVSKTRCNSCIHRC